MCVWGYFNFYEKSLKNKNKIILNLFNFVVGKICEYVYVLMFKIDIMMFKKIYWGYIYEIKLCFWNKIFVCFIVK